MSEVQYNSCPALTQPLVSASFQKTVDDLAQSPRGDLRAITALLTIERENAAADTLLSQSTSREATTDIPIACGGTAPPEGAPAPDTRSIDLSKGQTPPIQALQMQKVGKRIDRALRRDKPLNLSRKPWRVLKAAHAPVKHTPRAAPVKRAARARAVHSHTASHGGARKAADDGSGGGGGGGGDGGSDEKPSTPGSQSGGDYGIWGTAASYAAAKRCGFLDPISKPRPGYAFVNANCECWRRQFSNLFCTNCTPVVRREMVASTDVV